jgi:hypothetical protein
MHAFNCKEFDKVLGGRENYHIHSNIVAASDARSSVSGSGRICWLTSVQIQESLSAVDPGVLGLSTAVLALTSSCFNSRKACKVSSSAPS